MSESIWASISFAAFLDTFFVTGYFTYGGAIGAAATVAFANGFDRFDVTVFAYIGVVAGEAVNAALSSLPRAQSSIQMTLSKVHGSDAWYFKILRIVLFKDSDNTLIAILKYSILRFIALTRPVNVALLCSSRISPYSKIIAVILGAAVWVVFWTVVFESIAKLIKLLF